MTPEQIRALVEEYTKITLYAGEEERLTRKVSDEERDTISMVYTDMLEEAHSQLLSGNFSRIAPIADELLQTHHLEPLPTDSLEYQRLCRELLKAQQLIFKIESDRWDGNYWEPHTADYGAIHAGKASAPVFVTPSKLFSEVVALYFKEHTRQPRTDAQIKSGYEKFVQIMGGDRPIGEIAKVQCRQYKEALSRLPRSVKAKDRDKSAVELLKSLPPVGKYQAIGVSSVNKYLHNLSHLFDWARGQGFYEGVNPVEGLTINKRQVGKEKRKPFTDEDLTRIFGHPEFKAQQTAGHPERYWVVLILAFSGGRREEVAQLEVADIKTEDGVPYLHITSEGETGKNVKTEASRRRVPIHSALISLGLLHYMEQIKMAKHTRLFPTLKKGHNGYGDAVGKWFGRHLTRVGITDSGKVIHSFRHTIVTRLTAAGVPQDMREVLVGHAADTVHGSTYVHREGIPLALLKTHLEKVDYSGCLKGLR